MSNALWNLHAAAVPDAECSDFDTVTEWAANEIESLRQQLQEVTTAFKQCQLQHTLTIKELAALKQDEKESALVKFAKVGGYDEIDPLERLRFYCSLAMRGADWLDSEQFFDALKQAQVEPVVWMQSDQLSHFEHHSCGSQSMLARCSDIKLQNDYVPLYTSAPTILEGWQLVPIEPTREMLLSIAYETTFCDPVGIYNKLLAAAPKPK